MGNRCKTYSDDLQQMLVKLAMKMSLDKLVDLMSCKWQSIQHLLGIYRWTGKLRESPKKMRLATNRWMITWQWYVNLNPVAHVSASLNMFLISLSLTLLYFFARSFIVLSKHHLMFSLKKSRTFWKSNSANVSWSVPFGNITKILHSKRRMSIAVLCLWLKSSLYYCLDYKMCYGMQWATTIAGLLTGDWSLWPSSACFCRQELIQLTSNLLWICMAPCGIRVHHKSFFVCGRW